MDGLQRWNFIARARLERELWEAFERQEDLEALVQACRQQLADGAEGASAFRLEVWQTTLQRIRKIEAMMAAKTKPGPGSD
ncbi:MAG: hypothetical protein R6W06_03170 [Prochlorococcaceae cyanobacterium]